MPATCRRPIKAAMSATATRRAAEAARRVAVADIAALIGRRHVAGIERCAGAGRPGDGVGAAHAGDAAVGPVLHPAGSTAAEGHADRVALNPGGAPGLTGDRR